MQNKSSYKDDLQDDLEYSESKEQTNFVFKDDQNNSYKQHSDVVIRSEKYESVIEDKDEEVE